MSVTYLLGWFILLGAAAYMLIGSTVIAVMWGLAIRSPEHGWQVVAPSIRIGIKVCLAAMIGLVGLYMIGVLHA